MSGKCIALIIAGFVLCAVSSAQEYSIRANRGLNLRAEPSRNAAIADTVRSGTILQVVGEFNRWLKIDRNGREVWLADWVDFSRVDDSASPASSALPAPTGPIDNCCYVDRQCHSELDWMGGWHAFQNGQCAAPPQPQPVTPAQPGSSAPANVDNCCLVDRQCSSDQEWINGYWAFQNNQCPAPAKLDVVTPSRPRIEGSARFVAQTESALNLLQRRAREWYDYVIRYVDLIREIPDSYPDCTTFRAFVLDPEPANNVYVDTCMALTSLINYTVTLPHEACHRRKQVEGIVYPGGIWEEELQCSKPSVAVARLIGWFGTIGDPEVDIARLRATNCFAKINSYEDFYRVLEDLDKQGADFTC